MLKDSETNPQISNGKETVENQSSSRKGSYKGIIIL
jgi:hypothetical protein